jgi:hypothetical protein
MLARTLLRLCIRLASPRSGFPLARLLPSAFSAADRSALFDDFFGTVSLSDFSRSCIIDVRLLASRRGPRGHPPWTSERSPSSGAEWFRTCLRSPTPGGPRPSRMTTRWVLPSACLDGVGTSDRIDFRAQYPACACPCQRSTPSLAADGVWLRVGVARYAFPVRLFHPLLSARFTGAFQDSIPAGWPSLGGEGI